MDLTQHPELRQKVTLSPQVYQGLSILAMPVAELHTLIENEILENPVLEVEEDDYESVESEERLETSEEERAWDEWLDQYEELERMDGPSTREPVADDVNTEEFVGGVVSFTEYLLEQLAMMDIDDDLEVAAKAVIGSLDGDGFFVGTEDEIAAIAGVTLEVAVQALGVVQQLDPPGVGARSVPEALRIQAETVGLDTPLLLATVDGHLDDVAASRYKKIARALGSDEASVRETVEMLRTLNPRPAGAFSPGSAPAYVVPDVTVRRFDDEWLVLPNTEAVPGLRVNSRYRSLLRSDSSADDETRRYLKDKVRQAESFMRNVDRRRDTVSRIAEIVLEVQRDFFEDGQGDLRPLRLEDVAVELGVHLSTVSRGVTGKYMATPYGLFELKHFFSGGYRTSTGMDVAATTVKKRLKELLEAEDPEKPMSDQRLADALSEQGVDVARRTVAKYREELGVEPSWARKRR
ncbi:RNA polymerase factor sigma-54 [Anaerosoma tenue]|uniref:RNA polymerase factor sigma-54 n=1 Tax=Anaerosoma tenue TaxID=2933588 RepID=UPI002260F6F4|nr:RNA polymerase factor sigma-54 [Anaerosoma tenue]MCK8113944.1 RNA polymerase factor sigma-54 [Anaerosoma tenue]